jgi:hypothetical protein
VNAPTDEVRLYASWRGMLLAFGAPLVPLLLGIGASADGGPNVLTVLLTLFGLGLLVVSLFDFPLSVTFSASGIARRTVLRLHRMRWDSINAITRAPTRRLLGRAKRVGPLCAAVGKRRYLLVDRVEGIDEFDAMRALVQSLPDLVPIPAEPPAPETAPTWLYHRKRGA